MNSDLFGRSYCRKCGSKEIECISIDDQRFQCQKCKTIWKLDKRKMDVGLCCSMCGESIEVILYGYVDENNPNNWSSNPSIIGRNNFNLCDKCRRAWLKIRDGK